MTEVLRYSTTDNYVEPVRTHSDASGIFLVSLIAELTDPIGIEIGTDVGETAAALLFNVPTLKLHCIDPYTRYVDWNGNDLNDRNDVLYKMRNRLAPFANRYTLHQFTSDEAVSGFWDESVDFIFVDGLHTYEQVLADCHNYYRKLKPGGIFAGHDFNAIEGVRRAVVEFAASVGKEIKQDKHDTWYWVK